MKKWNFIEFRKEVLGKYIFCSEEVLYKSQFWTLEQAVAKQHWNWYNVYEDEKAKEHHIFIVYTTLCCVWR